MPVILPSASLPIARIMKTAGIAINSMTIAGLTKAEDLGGRTFELGGDIEDELNELAESVIVEPGNSLGLSHLKIDFGSLKGGVIDLTLEAECVRLNPDTFNVEEENIPVRGTMAARVSLD